MKDAQIFDEFPVWKNLMFLPEEARKQAFADPTSRQKMRDDMAEPRPVSFHRNWGRVFVEKVANGENQKYVGKSVAEVGTLRQQDPLDAFPRSVPRRESRYNFRDHQPRLQSRSDEHDYEKPLRHHRHVGCRRPRPVRRGLRLLHDIARHVGARSADDFIWSRRFIN